MANCENCTWNSREGVIFCPTNSPKAVAKLQAERDNHVSIVTITREHERDPKTGDQCSCVACELHHLYRRWIGSELCPKDWCELWANKASKIPKLDAELAAAREADQIKDAHAQAELLTLKARITQLEQELADIHKHYAKSIEARTK